MKKIIKEIEKQEKEDPTNPKNILSILEKNKKRNLKKLSRSKSMPYIRNEYDIRANNPSAELGRNVIRKHIENRIPLKDIETGEDIKLEFFITNREVANVTYQSGVLRRIDLTSRPRFIYFVN